MRRAHLLSFGLAFVAFVVLDLLFHFTAVWLGKSEMPRASAVVGQLLLPFAPIIVSGLIAGYIGTPNGFTISFFAGALGSLSSILWRYYGVALGQVGLSVNAVAIASWVVGTAAATGVCGWAGERMHGKLRK